MKRVFYLIIDLFIIYGSIAFVFYLLENIDMLEDFQKNFEAFTLITPFIGILYLILMYAFGLYNITRKNLTELIYTVFLISVSLLIGTMGICFFVRDIALAFPRSVILLSGLFYFIFLTLWYILTWSIGRKIHGVKKIVIIGEESNKMANAILSKYPKLYQIENRCSEKDPFLSTKIESVDEVFLCPGILEEIREKIILLCLKHKKEVVFVPKYFELNIMAASFYKTDDIPTFRISGMDLSPEESFVKRAVDLMLGSIASIIFLPFGLIVAALVKLDGGSIFYAQERLTKGNQVFKILKFRTMIPDAEKLSGPILANENDPRITKIGRFIRAVRLDEIPQLINILKGDMSIVGPRPERPFFVEQFEKDIPEYQYRLKVKAGLTGLAQVEGKYNTTVDDKLLYDLIYINNYSVWRDLLIMLQTVKILFVKSSTEGVSNNS